MIVSVDEREGLQEKRGYKRKVWLQEERPLLISQEYKYTSTSTVSRPGCLSRSASQYSVGRNLSLPLLRGNLFALPEMLESHAFVTRNEMFTQNADRMWVSEEFLSKSGQAGAVC